MDEIQGATPSFWAGLRNAAVYGVVRGIIIALIVCGFFAAAVSYADAVARTMH